MHKSETIRIEGLLNNRIFLLKGIKKMQYNFVLLI